MRDMFQTVRSPRQGLRLIWLLPMLLARRGVSFHVAMIMALGLFLGAVALHNGAQAALNDDTPQGFIDHVSHEAFSLLKNTDLTEKQRIAEFGRLFRENFDVDRIARFALGRYWRTTPAPKRVEYQALFADFIVNTYAARFGVYEGQKIEITGAKRLNAKETMVHSKLILPDRPPVRVDWRVRKGKDGRLRIVDVVVEGVSMAITHRSEFAAVIQRDNGRIDGLLQRMREKALKIDYDKPQKQ